MYIYITYIIVSPTWRSIYISILSIAKYYPRRVFQQHTPPSLEDFWSRLHLKLQIFISGRTVQVPVAWYQSLSDPEGTKKSKNIAGLVIFSLEKHGETDR